MNTVATALPTRLSGASPDVEVPLQCDTSRKFVRVIKQRADGLVAFEFAIGWPELAVELLLPQAGFAEFCATHRVQLLAV